MTREFSAEARNWLINYHGSIDATALLLAFDAGVRSRDTEVAKLTEQLLVAQEAAGESATIFAEGHNALVHRTRELQAQLLAAQATIAKAKTVTGRSWQQIVEAVQEVLTRQNTSALDEHDTQIAAAAVRDYVSTRGPAKLLIEFTNQPVFDAAIKAARVKELQDTAVALNARADELFAASDKAWTESEFGKRDTDWEHPGKDALADAAASGVMKRDAEWLKAQAASIEKGN